MGPPPLWGRVRVGGVHRSLSKSRPRRSPFQAPGLVKVIWYSIQYTTTPVTDT